MTTGWAQEVCMLLQTNRGAMLLNFCGERQEEANYHRRQLVGWAHA